MSACLEENLITNNQNYSNKKVTFNTKLKLIDNPLINDDILISSSAHTVNNFPKIYNLITFMIVITLLICGISLLVLKLYNII